MYINYYKLIAFVRSNYSDLYGSVLLFHKMMNLQAKSLSPPRGKRKEARRMTIKLKTPRRKLQMFMTMQQKGNGSGLKGSKQISKEKKKGEPLLKEIIICWKG